MTTCVSCRSCSRDEICFRPSRYIPFSFKPGLTIHIFLSIIQPNGDLIVGALGPDNGGLKVEEGYEAARHCGLNIIATLKEQLGDLDRVEQVVKVRVA